MTERTSRSLALLGVGLPPPSADESRRRWLERYLRAGVPVAAVYTVTTALGAVLLGNQRLFAASGAVAAFGLALAWAGRLLRRGSLQLATRVVLLALLICGVGMSAILPFADGPLVLTALLSAVVALPLLEAASLVRHFVMTLAGIGSIALVSMLYHPRDGLPQGVRTFLDVSALMTISGLVLFLLATSRRQLQAVLAAHDLARADAEDAGRRALFLADASQMLASLDGAAPLQALAHRLVPRHADLCWLQAVGPDGALRCVAEAAGDELAAAALRAMQAGAGPARATHAITVVDLLTHGRKVGVLTVGTLGEQGFSAADLRMLEDLGHRIAISLDHERVVAERRRAEDALRLLAEASSALGSTLDPQAIATHLSRTAVPTLADSCTVDFLEGADQFRRVAHSLPEMAHLLAVVERYPPRGDAGVPAIMRGGEPVLMRDVGDELFRSVAQEGEHLEALRAIGARSIISVPLMARGRILGALTCALRTRNYEPQELAPLADLGRRAAIALDNARLFREAKEAVQRRDEFLSIASHELKTPLTSLQLHVQNLLRLSDANQVPAERLPVALRTIERQVRRQTRLINDLLTVSRIAAGRLELEPEPVDLVELTREVIERFDAELERTGTRVLLEGPAKVAAVLDRSRIDQVLTNLISNAVKYGGGQPVVVALESIDGAVTLRVSDRGIGIAPKDLDRIFGRFERAVSERNYGGFGLGLWITRELVRSMDGAIRVVSDVGSGAVFTVEIPQHPAPVVPPAAGASP